MSFIVSGSVALSAVGEFPAWSPVIGWHNLVTAANVSTGNADVNFPTVNLATDNTAERWQASSADDQRIVVDLSDYVGDIDYIAVARHNFGSVKAELSVEVYTDLDVNGLPDWQEVIAPVIPANNSPKLFRIAPQAVLGICIRIQNAIGVPRAAILYAGKLLILKPTIQTDFTPLNLGRRRETVTDRNEVGDFLGRMVLSEGLESSVSLLYLDPAWYRQYMDPFVAAAATTPFFFAWDPLGYPDEVGFAWIRPGSHPQPSIYENVGLMSITLDMSGIMA